MMNDAFLAKQGKTFSIEDHGHEIANIESYLLQICLPSMCAHNQVV